MPLPRRGGEPRLAGARVIRTSLPRATPRSPKRVGRGAPLLSHAQRLTRRRHSSEQVPPEPEQADFRSGKWLQERAGGDARDPRHTPLARMSSRQRSVAAVPLGRAVPSSRGVGEFSGGVRTAFTVPACQPALSPAPGPTWNRPPLNRPAHAATWTRLDRALGRASDGATSDWPVPVTGQTRCHSRVSPTARPILKLRKGSDWKGSVIVTYDFIHFGNYS